MYARTGAGLAVLVLLSAVTVQAAEPAKSTAEQQVAVEVTVYNSNIGLIKDVREIQLPEGEGELHFMDVASAVIPETVHARSLNHAQDFQLLEQNYE